MESGNHFEQQHLSAADPTSSMGGSSRRRRSLSIRIAPDIIITDDDIESEVVSQAGDIGERELPSRRFSRSGSLHSAVENFVSVEDGGDPVTDETFGSFAADSVRTDMPSHLMGMDPSGTANTSLQPVKEFKKELPPFVEYISCLIHLAVFGILGVYSRYLLQKLFGPQGAGVTSDQTFVYLDLPSNMAGSFLMGWLGVIFKGDISHLSELLAIGLTTGYLGSLTTFSGWNQKMLDLSVKGQWVDTAWGIVIGLGLAAMSIRFGIATAKGFRWFCRRLSRSDASSTRNSFRIVSLAQHVAVLVVLLLILGLILASNGVLLGRWFASGKSNGQLWLACIVGPLGVWARWLLAKLNGQGIGRNGSLKWIPFGTLIANVSAACVMALLATVKEVVNTERCDTLATGIQFGFLGCLSTVSTFIAEFHAMCESKHPWRAFVYASITLLPSFILGTLIYSIPMWTKGYQ